jgi:hypothetical protein
MIEFEWPWMLLALPIPLLIIAFKNTVRWKKRVTKQHIGGAAMPYPAAQHQHPHLRAGSKRATYC